LRVHIDKGVWHLDVGLGTLRDVAVTNRWIVHPLISYMSWVQTGESQVSFYPCTIYI